MQIRTRITIQFIVVVTLLISAAFLIIYYSSASYRRSEFFERLNRKLENSLEIYSSVNKRDSTLLRNLERKQKDKLRFERVVIYNKDFKETFSTNDSIHITYPSRLFDELAEKGYFETTINEYEVAGSLIRDDETNEVYYGIVSAYDVFGYSKLSNLSKTLFLLFLSMISLTALTGWFYAKRALNPLSVLLTEIESLDINRLDKKLTYSDSNDEIGRLIREFNELLGRIQYTVQLKRLFISGASHELKNPLTTITSQLQVALMKDRTSEEYKKTIASILEDIRNLNQTAIELIEYSRLNSENDINPMPVRIDDILWEACDEVKHNFPQYSIGLNFSEMPLDESENVVAGNASLLKVAFVNLIENACKFSDDSACKINFSSSRGAIVITFTDNGVGLNEEELKYIFEPFYRANSTTQVKGHGIGLALTRRILELHGTDIIVKSQPNIGSEFKLAFPIIKE